MQSPPSPTPSPTPTASEMGTPREPTGEIVTRPDPGLARGKWEAPPWVFWVFLVVVVGGSVGYLLHRLGVLKLKKREETPPPSRGRRP